MLFYNIIKNKTAFSVKQKVQIKEIVQHLTKFADRAYSVNQWNRFTVGHSLVVYALLQSANPDFVVIWLNLERNIELSLYWWLKHKMSYNWSRYITIQ